MLYLLDHMNKLTSNISILIGPEGGFTNEERFMINQYNDKYDIYNISLGNNILRSELAAINSISLLEMMLNKIENNKK